MGVVATGGLKYSLSRRVGLRKLASRDGMNMNFVRALPFFRTYARMDRGRGIIAYLFFEPIWLINDECTMSSIGLPFFVVIFFVSITLFPRNANRMPFFMR